MTDKTATITLGGKSTESPVLSGSVGPDVVDIRKFYGQTGAFTYDPGFTSTASCESKLTYIDGDEAFFPNAAIRSASLPKLPAFWKLGYLLSNADFPPPAEWKSSPKPFTATPWVTCKFPTSFPDS